MKKIYTLLALALVSGSVMAQSKDGVKFGVRGGVNLAKYAYSGSAVSQQDKDDLSSLVSYNFGGYADIPVSEVFSVQPGLSISGKGSKINTLQSGVTQGIPYSAKVKSSRDVMYLELPVNAVFKIQNFYIGAGPYLGYALSGRDKFKGSANVVNPSTGATITVPIDYDEKIKIGNDKANDDLKPLDFGLNALAGYRFDSGLNFGVNYGLGLANSDVDNSSDYKASNRVLSVLVGFSF